MNIFYIANARIPTEKAHGIQIMKMCEAFADLGNKVVLVLPGRKNPSLSEKDPYKFYSVKENFEIKYLNSYDPVWLLKFPQGWYTKFQAFLFSTNLRKYLNGKISDSYVYTRDEYLLPVLLEKTNNVVWEAHNLPTKKSFYGRFWQRCKMIICISHGLKNELVETGLDQNKLLVAPDGVDLTEFDIDTSKEEAREKNNLPKDAKIALYTGHLYDWKGAKVLAEAAKFLENVKVIFVGGTADDLNNFSNSYGTNGNIQIVGPKPYTEIPTYLKAADVLVLPNTGEKNISKNYTSPLKMFEYMASKRPIVASDLPSIAEILNKDLAYLVQPDSPQALAEAIKSALSSSEVSLQKATAAYQKVAIFSWQERAKKIIQYLSNVR